MPFLLAEILNFQGSTHLTDVGSFSHLFIGLLSTDVCMGRKFSGCICMMNRMIVLYHTQLLLPPSFVQNQPATIVRQQPDILSTGKLPADSVFSFIVH